MLNFSVKFYEIKIIIFNFIFLLLYKKLAHKDLAGFMKKVYGSPKADQKNRETFMFSSFSFSALVVATSNNKLQKKLCDNCGVYVYEQKKSCY